VLSIVGLLSKIETLVHEGRIQIKIKSNKSSKVNTNRYKSSWMFIFTYCVQCKNLSKSNIKIKTIQKPIIFLCNIAKFYKLKFINREKFTGELANMKNGKLFFLQKIVI